MLPKTAIANLAPSLPRLETKPAQSTIPDPGRLSRSLEADQLGTRLDQVLRTLWQRYRRAFKSSRRGLSTGTVHKLRVETRRILSMLDLLEPLVGKDEVAPARRRLRRTFRKLSRLRDTHVQLLAFKRELRRHSGARVLRRAWQRREAKMSRRIQRQLRRNRLRRTREDLAKTRTAARACFKNTPSSVPGLAVILGEVNKAFACACKRHRSIDPTDPETIHRARVAFKRFRYMVEALESLFPGSQWPSLPAMQTYQTRMGEIQDTRQLLAEIEKRGLKEKLDPDELRELREDLVERQRRLISVLLASKNALQRFWPPGKPLLKTWRSGKAAHRQ